MRPRGPRKSESWWMSYAALATLLFALFAALYARAQAETRKIQKKVSALEAFCPKGTIEAAEVLQGLEVAKAEDPAGAHGPDQQSTLEEIQELISESLAESGHSGNLVLRMESRGLVIELKGNQVFAPGQLEVSQSARSVLDRIGKVLALAKRRYIQIEAHAARAEGAVAGVPSSWELSALRASRLVRQWIEQFGMDPAQLGASGYGAHRGMGPSRIEIVVLR